MTNSEIIKGIIDLFSSPDSWVKHNTALTKDNAVTSAMGPEAAKFCLGGAIIHVSNDVAWQSKPSPIRDQFNDLARARGYRGNFKYPFVLFNDDFSTTHEDMMLFLKEALYEAEKEEIN